MSLIGSLDDLGLGDILQIINLSQKSGVLIVTGDRGEGRIVFRDGLVRGAALKSGPSTLRDILVGGDVVSADAYETAIGGDEDGDARKLLAESQLIADEELLSLCRGAVEDAVIEMFSWRSGEFSFDVRSGGEPGDPELFLETGVNAQYLAMEGARQQDELAQSGASTELEFAGGELESEPEVRESNEAEVRAAEFADAPLIDAEPVFQPSAEVIPEHEVEHEAENDVAGEVEEAIWVAPVSDDPPAADACVPRDEIATPAAAEAEIPAESPVVDAPSGLSPGEWQQPAGGSAVDALEVDDADAGAVAAAGARRPPLVVIDPELRALEWVKRVLKGEFPRVHIFQQSNQGLVRIRQYLSRAEVPLVLISPDAAGEPSAGIHDATDFALRLKRQAPNMSILWLYGTSSPPPDGPGDGSVCRPRLDLLRDARAASERDGRAEVLRRAVLEVLARVNPAPAGGGRPLDAVSDPALQRLRAATEDLSEASARGEVLPRVIEFARESFSRVAMFMVRDGRARGMAQSGLSAAGGPDSDAFCEMSLAIDDCAWFERVLRDRVSLCAPASEADGELCDRLCGPGGQRPLEAYVAPIESSGQIVALLYADQLPARQEIGDTSALEVVLSHAGLALDRAVLQRALHDVSDDRAD